MMLEKYYGKKVVVLIDEYDAPYMSAMKHKDNSIEDVNDLIGNILCSLLKNNKSLLTSVMMGITTMPLNEMGSGLNTLKEFNMYDK